MRWNSSVANYSEITQGGLDVTATFTATTYPDTDAVYLGIAKDCASFGAKFTLEEIEQLKEVLENATR
jgi:hypothetical protein